MVDRRGRARSFRRVASLGVEVRVRPRSGHLKFFFYRQCCLIPEFYLNLPPPRCCATASAGRAARTLQA